MTEEVLLVDDQNNEIGTAPKDLVHSKQTPLHRAFSCFVFNDGGEILLTKRAQNKKTFPGVWTNTVCGHPKKGESSVDAAKRRLLEELGLTIKTIKDVAPYRYCFSDRNGIMENEICPILVGKTNENPNPEHQEVEDWKWMRWDEFLKDIKKQPDVYSPWCFEEAEILESLGISKKEII